MTREPRSAFALLAFAMGVFVVSFPLMVIALRDFGPATATLVRMLAGGAVLALAARGSFDALRGSALRIAVIGAFGLGLQSWLLAYAMTHVGGALPALVLGLEPILIGLVGSLVVREHVGAAPAIAFAIGLVGEAVIAGFVSAGAGERPLLPLAALAGVVTLFSAYSVSLRKLAALPSAAVVCVSSLGGAVAVLPLVAIELARGDAVQAFHAGTGARAGVHGRRRGRPRLPRLGGRALARARGRGGARPLPPPDRRSDRIPRRPGRAALRPPRRRRGDRDRGDRARSL